jgi:hypothetical protein
MEISFFGFSASRKADRVEPAGGHIGDDIYYAYYARIKQTFHTMIRHVCFSAGTRPSDTIG